MYALLFLLIGQDDRGDQFTYLKIREYLLNPPVLEGETPIHHDPAKITSRQIAQFCEEYYLNPMAMKKALELRIQYQYFLDLLPRDAVQSLSAEAAQPSDEDPIMYCLIKAYFKNICMLSSNGCYVPINLLNTSGSNEGDIEVYLHPDSMLHLVSKVGNEALYDHSPIIGCYLKTFSSQMRSTFEMSVKSIR